MEQPSRADRVAIVTGGTGGIGSAVARRLSAAGMAIVVHYGGNAAEAESLVETIKSGGAQATSFAGDVADADAMAALFAHTLTTFGGVDVVVHTAGIMPLAPLADMELEEFDRIQRTNVRGTFVIDQLAARNVREGGAIVNFSTTITRLQPPTYSAYAASKAAVEALTLILARELRGRNITVNAVAPGPTATPLFLQGKPQELIDTIAAANPMQRLGTPDDIAEVVASLAGPARWINGQVLYVNGGAA